ncbi:hypothetical protein HLB23_13745 [Nocardia uniformis]|uniref:Mce-associated membrane protein n=1 Tax=Nocardia uniformis TaxID=53432 RepID=A0A849C394_9NOCA|nr:hypothetical protein [Nocardia uniformis]NNH70910.1 hypothetical protein [Nocardia uniformis]
MVVKGMLEEPTTTVEDAEPHTDSSESTTTTKAETPTAETPKLSATKLLSAVTLLAIVVAGILGFTHYRDAAEIDRLSAARTQLDDQTAAMNAARDFVTTVTTYNHSDLDPYVTAVAAATTGKFHDQYATAGDAIKNLISGAKVVSTGKVVETGVSRVDPSGDITVILFVDLTFQNADTPAPRNEGMRMFTTLHKVGDRWLVSDMGPR